MYSQTDTSLILHSLIREPLQGIPSVVPLADSAEDPILDEWKFYVTRTPTVIANILRAVNVDAKKIEKVDKTLAINLPGVSISTRDILSALVEVGGEDALKFVSYKANEAVKKIVNVWAGDYFNSEEIGLGFAVDDAKTGYMDAVKDFQKAFKKQ